MWPQMCQIFTFLIPSKLDLIVIRILVLDSIASPMSIHTVHISLDLHDELDPSVHTKCELDPRSECSNLHDEPDQSSPLEQSVTQEDISIDELNEDNITSEVHNTIRNKVHDIIRNEVDLNDPIRSQVDLNDPIRSEVDLNDPIRSEVHDTISDGEGDVEIENVCVDGNDLDQTQLPSQDLNQTVTFDVRRRTLINVWQRATLEEYYRGGMWSAALQLHHMHVSAAEKTGLDLTVVKNWIRNRRRPTAARSAEKLAEYISQAGTPISPLSLSTINPILTIPSTMAPVTVVNSHQFNVISRQMPNTGQPAVAIVTGTPAASVSLARPSTGPMTFGPPDVKKACIELAHHRTTSPPTSLHQFSAPTLTPFPSHQSTPVPHPATHGSTTFPVPMLVRVRISDSGDEDFVEVEVPSLTYQALLKAICDELEIAHFDIAKIRKLPNILVRKDRDVHRLKEGQELEVILTSTTQGMNHPPHVTKGLVVAPNPEADRNILATLSGESITSTLNELTGGHVSTHQHNGLHH